MVQWVKNPTAAAQTLERHRFALQPQHNVEDLGQVDILPGALGWASNGGAGTSVLGLQ